MRGVHRILLVFTLAAAALAALPAGAQFLVADLSERRININLRFAGAKVLLFGATDGEGDVAVVVRGPAQSVVVRRKERLGGIWINRDWVRFESVPAFYHVATSRSLEELGPPQLLSRGEIGLEHLRLKPVESAGTSEIEAFRKGLLRNRQREGLFGTAPGEVTFLEQRLFRTTVEFPANVVTGAYSVEVFLIRNDQVVNAQRWPLFISKSGIEADIYHYAHRYSALYGAIAVLGALVAGWLAAAVFRRM